VRIAATCGTATVVEGTAALAYIKDSREGAGVTAVEDAMRRSRAGEGCQRVWLRVKPRPEKCRAGVAVTVSGPRAVLSLQSNSVMHAGGMPQRSRCAPTDNPARGCMGGAGRECANAAAVKVA